MLNLLPTNRATLYRSALLIFVPALMALLPLLLSVTGGSTHYKGTWGLYGVPAMLPVFADLRGVTSTLQCYETDGDAVYSENRCDHWKRPYNYPRIWLSLRHIGVTEATTVPLGFCIGGAFLLCTAALFGHLLNWLGTIIGLALLCSPPVMLALERGNNDLIVYSLLALSIILLSRKPAAQWLGTASFLLASCLKLYPSFAFPILVIRKSSTAWMHAFGFILLFCLYIALTFGDLAKIDHSTASPTQLAYGARILLNYLIPNSDVGLFQSVPLWRIIMPAFIFSFAGLCGCVATRKAISAPELHLPPTSSMAFITGACIFLGTFIIDSHYYYRLIFLLFTTPLFLHFAAMPNMRLKTIGWLGAIGLIGQFWLEYFPLTSSLFLDEWCNWIMGILYSATVGLLFCLHFRNE